MRFEPRPRQRLALKFALERTHCAWWLQMGAGKTVCAYSVARHWLHEFEVRRVLVVAPKRVAEETWPTEREGWDHLAGLTLAEICGNPARRTAAAKTEADIYVVGVQNLPWLVKTFGKAWRWDALILDESSGVKRAGTERFKALRKVQHLFKRVLLLTGTPRPNSLLELWPQIWLLDRGERLGSSFTRYRNKWFDGDYHGYKWTPKPGAADEIHALLGDLCIALDSDAQLPDPVVLFNRVTLPPTTATEYARYARQQVLLARDGRPTIAAANAAALVGKLAQYASGIQYDAAGATHEVHRHKLDRLQSMVKEADGNVIIAYWFKADLARIQALLPQAQTLDTPDAVHRWNEGEIPILLLHPASAGHGLNLQFGGHELIFFGPIWSLELWQQTIARLHRTGQTRQVFVRVITAVGTVDDSIMLALQAKDAGQRSTLAAVTAHLDEEVR